MKIRQTKDGIEIETREFDVSKLIKELNQKVMGYSQLYGHDPKVIVVPEYIEYYLNMYCLNTFSGIFNKTYSTFMNILVIGTKKKDKIEEIEVF